MKIIQTLMILLFTFSFTV